MGLGFRGVGFKGLGFRLEVSEFRPRISAKRSEPEFQLWLLNTGTIGIRVWGPEGLGLGLRVWVLGFRA